MKKIILLFAVLAFFVTKSDSQTVTDYDGNIYDTVTIGTQVWLKENLKVTHYKNGDPISNVTDNSTWSNLTSGAYCDYENKASNNSIYGHLYNLYTIINSSKLCPTNWHIPSDTEWTILTNYLGGDSISGCKLKEIGLAHWTGSNVCATNETGFTALPGGIRYFDGSFYYIGELGSWWSSTKYSIDTAYNRYLYYNSTYIGRYKKFKALGFSARCLRDTPAEINEINYQEKIDIYPNPATDKISINSSTRQTLKMQVFNTVGQCVLQRELNNLTNIIDISSLTRGIYILKLTSLNGTFEKKIIKE